MLVSGDRKYDRKNTMSDFNFNSGKLTCNREQDFENYYLPNFIAMYVSPTVHELETAFTRRKNSTSCCFYFLYSREIKLSIFIIKFIRLILTRNYAINILSVNFAPCIQYTVILPKCYPIVTQSLPNENSSVHATRQGLDWIRSFHFKRVC